jgi:transcriptional regulator
MRYKQKLIKWQKRACRVVALRDKGWEFSAIAEKLGLSSRQQAHNIYKREKGRVK